MIRTLTLVMLLASMWLTPLAPARSVAAQESPYAWIGQEMTEIRGLPLLHEVEERYITREEFRVELENMEIEDDIRTQAEGTERTMQALGLIPEGTDLLGVTLEEQAGSIVGYYDPDANEMVLISDAGGSEAFAQITYAHEFVHALQDQHFDISALQDQVRELEDSEAESGFRALVEGDASAAQFQFMLRHPDLLSGAVQGGSGSTASTPPVITESMLFPYLAGAGFVIALIEQGGWEAVNAAYDDLPVSSEQILHPERYIDEDAPSSISTPDIESALDSGWSRVDQDSVGELYVTLLFADPQPGQQSGFVAGFPEEATIAAEGWDGDRYETWAKGEQTVIVWRSIWDRRSDAAEFAEALIVYDAGRFGVDPQTDDSGTTVDGDDGSSRVVRNRREVIYVLAPTADLADEILAEIQGAAGQSD